MDGQDADMKWKQNGLKTRKEAPEKKLPGHLSIPHDVGIGKACRTRPLIIIIIILSLLRLFLFSGAIYCLEHTSVRMTKERGDLSGYLPNVYFVITMLESFLRSPVYMHLTNVSVDSHRALTRSARVTDYSSPHLAGANRMAVASMK